MKYECKPCIYLYIIHIIMKMNPLHNIIHKSQQKRVQRACACVVHAYTSLHTA